MVCAMPSEKEHKGERFLTRLRRSINVFVLQQSAGRFRHVVAVSLLLLASLVLVALAAFGHVGDNAAGGKMSHRTEAVERLSYQCGDPELRSLLGAVPVLRSGKRRSGGGSRRTKPVGIPAKGGRRRIAQALAKLERGLNGGWNRSEASVVPLGQNGYVRRDLPVYRAALDTHDFALQKRPKDGLLSVDELAGNSYSMILCLSFNTDHCFSESDFPKIGRSRKVNRIQALRDVIWSKHKFCQTINRAIRGLDELEFHSFTFECWVMPHDYNHLVEYSRAHDVNRWIVKPRSLGAGMGIYVVDSFDAIKKEKHGTSVVQSYLTDPHLIAKVGSDGVTRKYKWDLRTYVLVTSITPLRAYVYSRGLVRIATTPYSSDCTNVTACLTNTSLNKKTEGAQLKDITWSLYKLQKYLAEHEQDLEYSEIFLRIQKAIGLTLLSSESSFKKAFYDLHGDSYSCENCYHLLGVDVLMNDALEARVVEVNGEPSMKLTSNGRTHYDITKKSMASDLIGLVYNREGAAGSALPEKLSSWSQCVVEAGEETAPVQRDHLEYVLQAVRERNNLGGFRPVYPNRKLSGTYDKFLARLQHKEAEAVAKKPALSNGMAHADGTRIQLHRLTTALLNDNVVLPTISEPSWDDSGADGRIRGSAAHKKGADDATNRAEQDDGDEKDEDYGIA